MILNNINNKNITLIFDKITQVYSLDINLSNQVYNYITSYFSNYRYLADDLLLYNNFEPEIIIEKNLMARDEYCCLSINSFNDIDRCLENKKDSILNKLNKHKMQSIEIQQEIMELEKIYTIISDKIQKMYCNDYIISFSDVVVNVDSILTKNIDCYISKANSSFSKIIQIINIIIELESYNGDKYILYLSNVDTYLSKKELSEIKQMISKSNFIHLIIQTAQSNYLDFSLCEEINIVLDNRVEFLPNMNTLHDKVNRNIHENKYVSKDELIIVLESRLSELFEVSNNNKFTEAILESLKCIERNEKESVEIILDSTIII